MRNILILGGITLNLMFLFYACEKDKITDAPDYERQTSQDNSLAESTFNDIDNITLEAISRGDTGLSTYRLGETDQSVLSVCAHVHLTHDSIGPGGSVVVDFGNSSCYCADKRYRRGIINITYSGSYRDSGTIITTSFDNYFVGLGDNYMYQVTGNKTVTNIGLNDSGNINFEIIVNGQLINSGGAVMTWESARNREWRSGFSTPYIWSDDEYWIRGVASGTNFEGKSFQAIITNPLAVKLSCRWITKGTIDLTPSGKAARTIDFGSGNCDSLASVIINGTTFPFILR